MKLDLTPHTRINSKWIKDLNVRRETKKVIEKNMGSKMSDIAHSTILSDVSPQATETKEKMRLHHSKMFLHSKGKQQQNKETTQRMGEHIR